MTDRKDSSRRGAPAIGAGARSGWRQQRLAGQPEPPVPGLAARLAAAAVLADVSVGARTLDDAFHGDPGHQKLSGLDPRDRALARSIVTVSFRRLGAIRKAIARSLDKGAPKKAGQLEWHLVVGAAQLLFLDAPDHAAVDLAVRAARSDSASAPYAGLVNAVLRRIGREREALIADSDALVDDTPAWLAARWRNTFGEDVARAIAEAHRREPTLDLTVKSDPRGWAERLDGIVLPTGSVRLRGHAPIPELEGYAEGGWWVQDAAAAIPARLLGAREGERVADLCAAPGGKTAQLAHAGADVVAVDRSAERLKRLQANLDRLGLSAQTAVTDATTFDAPPFDAVLVDAPCSATGTIRRHPDVARTKRATDLGPLAATQTRLLDRAARLLKPGGRLIYCVCSLEPEEGAQQVEGALRRNPDLARAPIRSEEVGGLVETLTETGDFRSLPCHLPGETARLSGLDGFYAARLIRR